LIHIHSAVLKTMLNDF